LVSGGYKPPNDLEQARERVFGAGDLDSWVSCPPYPGPLVCNLLQEPIYRQTTGLCHHTSSCGRGELYHSREFVICRRLISLFNMLQTPSDPANCESLLITVITVITVTVRQINRQAHAQKDSALHPPLWRVSSIDHQPAPRTGYLTSGILHTVTAALDLYIGLQAQEGTPLKLLV
jgi:hypothetical protein